MNTKSQKQRNDYEEAIRRLEECARIENARRYWERVAEAEKRYGPEFNAVGACPYIEDDRHVERFYKGVTSVALNGKFSFDEQALLAKHLVTTATIQRKEFCNDYLRQAFNELAMLDNDRKDFQEFVQLLHLYTLDVDQSESERLTR